MSHELTQTILHYLTDAPTSEFRQAPVKMIDHWQGEENLLWRVQISEPDAVVMDAVVKLFLDAGQARSRRQFDGMHFAANYGLSLTPLWVDRYPEGLARQVLVYHWADGEPLDPADPGALDALVASMATLHNADVEPIRRFSPRPLNLDYFWRIEQGSIGQILAWLPGDLAIVAAYRRLVDEATRLVDAALPLLGQTPPTPVHGDLSLANALLYRGQALLVDWEQFGLGDPALEGAHFLQADANALSAEQAEAWRTAYLMQINQPAMEARLELYRRLLAFNAVTYLLVGLKQHIAATAASELAEVQPFLQQTLAAAWVTAAERLGVTLDAAPQSFIAPFFTWLIALIAPDAA